MSEGRPIYCNKEVCMEYLNNTSVHTEKKQGSVIMGGQNTQKEGLSQVDSTEKSVIKMTTVMVGRAIKNMKAGEVLVNQESPEIHFKQITELDMDWLHMQ